MNGHQKQRHHTENNFHISPVAHFEGVLQLISSGTLSNGKSSSATQNRKVTHFFALYGNLLSLRKSPQHVQEHEFVYVRTLRRGIDADGTENDAFTVEHTGKGDRWSLRASDKETADRWCDAINTYALRKSTDRNIGAVADPLHFDALKRSLWTHQWRRRHFMLSGTVLTYYEKKEYGGASMGLKERGQFTITSADVSHTTYEEAEIQLQTLDGEPVRLKLDISLASKVLHEMLLWALAPTVELRWSDYHLVNATKSDDWCTALRKRRECSHLMINDSNTTRHVKKSRENNSKEKKCENQRNLEKLEHLLRTYHPPQLLLFGGTGTSKLPALVKASDNVDSTLHHSASHQKVALRKTTQLLHLGMVVSTRGGEADKKQQELQQQNISSTESSSSSWFGVDVTNINPSKVVQTVRSTQEMAPTDASVFSLPVGTSRAGARLSITPHTEGEMITTPRARRGHVLVALDIGKGDKSIFLHGGVALHEETGDTLLSATSAYTGAGAGQGQSLLQIAPSSRVLADCWCIPNLNTADRLSWAPVSRRDTTADSSSSSVANFLPPRHHHTMSSIRGGDGKHMLLLCGGIDEEGNVRSDVIRVVPDVDAAEASGGVVTVNETTPLPSLLFARAAHGALSLGRCSDIEKLLVLVGGVSDGNGRRVEHEHDSPGRKTKTSSPIFLEEQEAEPLPLLEAFSPQGGSWMTPVTVGAELPEGSCVAPAVTVDEHSGAGYALLFGHPARTAREDTGTTQRYRPIFGTDGQPLLFRFTLNRSAAYTQVSSAANNAPVVCVEYIETLGRIPRPVGGLQMCATHDACGALWLYLFGAGTSTKSATEKKDTSATKGSENAQQSQTSSNGWGLLSQMGKMVTDSVAQVAKSATTTVNQPIDPLPIALRLMLPASMKESTARDQIASDDDIFW